MNFRQKIQHDAMSQKVTRKELKNILGVHYNTACKEYRVIMDSMQLTSRGYLTIRDLISYGVL